MNSGTYTTNNDEIDVIASLRALWDFKYVIVSISSLFVLASLYIALTATPIFRADIVVAKVSDANLTGAASLANQFGGLGRLVGMNLGQGGSGREAQAVLESRRLVEEFIKRNDILNELSPDEGDLLTLWSAVTRFRARWANGFVALANELIRTRAREESERNIEYLNEQIEQTKEVGLQRVMYNLIETETQTLMLANARVEYAFTIVDPAVAPEIRISPKRKLIVLSGIALGLFFGVLAVFAINFFRQITTRKLPESQ
jgi:LPS O-antigen subunit length determinant protein (WzzB/FepE family)